MSRSKFLWASIVFFILGCFSLHLASSDISENPSNLLETTGVPAAVIYVAIMLGVGLVAVFMAGVGVLISTQLSTSSYRLKIAVFIMFNSWLVLASLLGILIIAGYVLDTFFSVVGVVLYALVIGLVWVSVPRRVYILK